MNKKLFFLIVTLVAILTLGGVYVSSAASTEPPDPKPEVIFSIPEGDKGIHYEKGDKPDTLTWGPAAMTIGPDGTFWIADTSDNHILHFDSRGVLLNKIDIRNLIVGAGDLEVTTKEIWILDIASMPPKIVQISITGKEIGFFNLPNGFFLENGLTGISKGKDGSILLEQEGGITVTQFISSEGLFLQKPLPGYLLEDKVYSSHPTPLPTDDPSHGYIMAGDKRISTDFATERGGVRVLNVNSDGGFWAIVDEVIFNPGVQVDQKVYYYDSSGNFEGMARVPIREMYTSVAHGVAVGPDGNVYVLRTKSDGAEVQKLVFSSRLSTILVPQTRTSVIGQNNGTASQNNCRLRSQMISKAKEYLNNRVYLNSYHINDPSSYCSSRAKPRYLTVANYYNSVPYAWGMWDTVAQFNSFMSINNNNLFAGDYNDPNSGCGRGIDCSGLVSQSWALGSHYGTTNIETIKW